MFKKNSIKLDQVLIDKLTVASQIMKCSTMEEFAIQVLEAEADKVLTQTASSDLSQDQIDDITNKLKGLGYLE
jgi:hypothetical protein